MQQSYSERCFFGKVKLVQVLVGDDIYYVIQEKIKNLKNKNFYWYEYMRKDLIQADDAVHADLLRKWPINL